MLNGNPNTGIRYSVIYCNSLDPDVVNELFYGPGATDLSYLRALQDMQAEAGGEADDIEYQATLDIPAGEEGKAAAAIEAAYRQLGFDGREDFIECKVERAAQWGIEIDEPEIEGEYEGVRYRIGWLGGAPLVICLMSPVVVRGRLCSPCLPNCLDLDNPDPDGYEGYGVPLDWLGEQYDKATVYHRATV